ENEKGRELFAIKSLNQTYCLFIEKMQEGAITISRDGIILYSNSAFASIVNIPVASVIGTPVINFIPSSYKDAFKKIFTNGWQSDCKAEVSFAKDNQLIPFLLSVTSIELDEGEALSIIFTDITFQKEHEKQLQIRNQQLEEARKKTDKMNEKLENIVQARTNELVLSMERFKFLADNTPVIIWTAEPDGAANYFNKLWCDYTGLTLEESKGSGSQQALHPDDYELTINTWANAIKYQTEFQLEYRIKRASDGQYRWHMGIGVPFKNEMGNTIAWIGSATDIENQKKEIEKKDEFISIASHELRTPLTSLKGYIQLIEAQTNLPDEVNLYLSKAISSANKLQHLVNDLLDASKIRAGKLQFSTHVFDLSDMVNDCVDNCRHLYPSHNIKKEFEKDIFICGNDERLEQVLINLINNSVKYSPENKEIIVRCEKNIEYGIVSVIDFGIGMSESEQSKIFDRFYRAENKKHHSTGLGMGLYIASEIIKEHKGLITVKSILNEGSVFSFSLPLAIKQQDQKSS
ncbi:MAG: PAS domain-containing sensor histidine kinase, partial [Ginsengibacter sp.]